jgi:GAF domain-containing protein
MMSRRVTSPKDQEAPINPPLLDVGEISIWRSQLVRGGLRGLLVIGLIAIVAGSFYAYRSKDTWVIPIYLGIYLALAFVSFNSRIPYKIQAGSLIGLVYLLGVIDLIESGRGGDGRVFLFTVPIMVVLFFGRSEGLASLGITILTMGVFTWLFSTERILIPVSQQANFADPYAWLSNISVIILLDVFLISSLGFIVPKFVESLTRSRRLLKRLDEAHKELREHSEELTRNHRLLNERAKVLEVIVALAREATSIYDLDTILDRVVNLISERFGFYHAAVFLTDSLGEWAYLRAASSEGGKTLVDQDQKIRVDNSSIVGTVIHSGKSRIASDLDLDVIYLENQHLPNTRSEITLPLNVRGQIIGALDIQSIKPETFTEDDTTLLQSLADQLAMVISNLRLFSQAQKKLEAERKAYQDLSNEAWDKMLITHPGLGYQYQQGIVTPLSTRGIDPRQESSSEDENITIEFPIQIRDLQVGSLIAKKDAGESWTLEERELVEAILGQMSAAMESARLFEDTQRQALRERLVTEITTKMRSSNNPESIVQTAVNELRHVLHPNQVEIHFHPKDNHPGSTSNGSKTKEGLG